MTIYIQITVHGHHYYAKNVVHFEHNRITFREPRMNKDIEIYYSNVSNIMICDSIISENDKWPPPNWEI